MELVSSYPWWYYFLCLLIGAAFAFALYYKDKSVPEKPRFVWQLLAFLRFATVSIISFLLLNPMIKKDNKITEKPIVLIINDDSKSILYSKDSAFYRKQFQAELLKLSAKFPTDFEVKQLSFSNGLLSEPSSSFNGRVTNLGKTLTDIEEQYGNLNLGAVVIATDGIVNEGPNPIERALRLKAPIYTIALGDTTPQIDLLIKKVSHNEIAYLNNNFTTKIEIEAFGFENKATTLTVVELKENGENISLFKNNVSITNSKFSSNYDVVLKAEKEGFHHYRVSLTPLNGEISKSNNVKDFFIEVVDNKTNVLILGSSPHPDLGAIKQALKPLQNLNIEVALSQNFNQNINQYQLIIAHQFPAQMGQYNAWINKATALKTPILFIGGKQTAWNVFNQVQKNLQVNLRNSATSSRVTAIHNSDFTYFTLTPNCISKIQSFPPLDAPFAEIRPSLNTSALLYNKVENVNTTIPLLAFSNNVTPKLGFLLGEGFWRWRLDEFDKFQTQDATDELIRKTIQYLSSKEDKRFFKCKTDERIYAEDASIFFSAELYSSAYEPVVEPDVSLAITRSDGKQYNYVLNRSTSSYVFNAGQLPPGKYSYEAKTTYNNIAYADNGTFSVQSIDYEGSVTLANHKFLQQLAVQTSGKMYFPNTMSKVVEDILNRGDIKPSIYTEQDLTAMIKYRWILGILICFFAIEWFMRKWLGGV